MKLLIILLILAVLFFGFSIPWCIRAYARIQADQIFYKHRPRGPAESIAETWTAGDITMCLKLLGR